jgi:uncharacterized protein YjiS (DUF1127 family)
MAAQAITSRDINALTGRSYPAPESGALWLHAFLRRFATWYEGNRRYRETVFELSRLSDYVLADIGIGRHQIREIALATRRRAA